MQYVMTRSERRKQQNLLIQAWRFVALSLRFMKLTCADCKYARRDQESRGLHPADAGQPRRLV
ncbi:MAG: hypothetical protein U9R74_09035 [Pseudomonadota bacterium]|nr:hypothetical protein [Pseudomonadota bacterium]